MTMNKNKIGTIVLFVILISCLFTTYVVNISKADSSTVVVWFTSDEHMGVPGVDDEGNWDNAVNDANGIGIDYHFSCGDHIYKFGADVQAMWASYHTYYNQIVATHKDYIIGNHDINWMNYAYSGYNFSKTYTFGNVVVIMTGEENIDADGNSTDYGGCLINITWIKARLAENVGKIRIVMTHYAEFTGPNTGAHITSDIYNNATLAPDFWLHGDEHIFYMSTMGYVTKISLPGMSIHPSSIDKNQSLFWTFTDGSNQVTMKRYNHLTDSYIDNYTMDLSYDFEKTEEPEEPEEPPGLGFFSISNQANDTKLTNSSILINGTKAGYDVWSYHIQISNNSIFNAPFFDFNNINETEYPTYLTETNNSFIFQLPEELEGYGAEVGMHYYRYRIGYRAVTE